MKKFIMHGGSIKRAVKNVKKIKWESRFAWIKHHIYLSHQNCL